ncbi:PGF-pre-PGF domain-containing protein [Candidatus Woesearchaeota archaeon]|nr:PGF-pre-PGF domain-containing protein [Candidatus Woesearchaeota archaeon]
MPQSTTATITINSVNETVNATINYGTTNTSLGSSATQTVFNSSPVVSLSGLTASSTYYFNVTVCDFNGNCKYNTTVFSFTTSAAAATTTTTTTTSSSSSSSSGGGGVAAVPAATAAATAVASAAKVWSTVTPEAPATITINKPTIAVSQVSIEVGTTVSNVEVSVKSLNKNPQATQPVSKVYQYLEITKSNIANADIKKATVAFKVPKSWLSQNSLGESDVTLYRYTTSWQPLATTKTGSDQNNVMYQANTPGFSAFAVGASGGGGSAFEIIDAIRAFYDGTSTLTAFDIIDKIRAFYGG